MIIAYIAGLILALWLINKICDRYFVESLESIAEKFKLSSDFAGATLMAIGSSAPELFTSIAALSMVGSEAVGAGTIIGSAIFNILIIIGVVAIAVKPGKNKLTWHIVFRDLAFYLGTVGWFLFASIDGSIVLWESVPFLVLYIAYIFVVSKWAKWMKIEHPKEYKDVDGEYVSNPIDRFLNKHYLLTFVLSIAAIGVTTHFMVDFAVNIADYFDIPSAIIGLTVLAAGTSVPDVLSSMVVAKKGRANMAVTNAVSSNIFDINIGLGAVFFSVLLYKFIKGESISIPIDSSTLQMSIIFLFGTVVLLLSFLFISRWKLNKVIGYSLILAYLAILTYNIVQIL